MRIHPAILLAAAALAGCVPKATPPRPAPPRPVPVPVPAPTAVPAPLAADWRDWPLTPGDWRYEQAAGGSAARFGGAATLLTLSCGADRRVQLSSSVVGAATVRTTSLSRSLPAGGVLAAADPLLDAMAFSRGRFVVEGGGTTLVLPAFAELSRVVEDCRAG